MAAIRIIKKYPNRRLYDTEISSYITIEDVRQLIVDGEDFEVSRVGLERTGQEPHHSCLPRSVRAEEHGHRAGWDLEIEAVDGPRLTKRPNHAARGDHSVHVVLSATPGGE